MIDARVLSYRDPSQVPKHQVCPHCKRPGTVFYVISDGHNFPVLSCLEHGDVLPMKSAVANAEALWPVGS